MRVTYNVVHEVQALIPGVNKRIHLTVESPRVKTNTKFLEHVTDSKGNPTPKLIASQDDNLLVSNNNGDDWELIELGTVVDKCFTTDNDFHILFCKEDSSIKVYSPDWRQLKVFTEIINPWHGSWSIDQSSNGVIMWAEYAFSDSVLRVHRSKIDGLEFEEVFAETGGGKDKPAEGRIRHFHTCQKDPFIEGVWYLSSGDTDSQCRMWKTEDDGDNWEEIDFNKDGISGFSDIKQVSPKLWRRTAEFIDREHIMYPTDDHLFRTGAKLVLLNKRTLGSPRIIGDLGPNEMRNFIHIEEGWNLAISESKNNRDSIFLYMCHSTYGVVKLPPIKNENSLKSNVCNSISSLISLDGKFWTFHDGIAIRNRPKILRWTIEFSDVLEEQDFKKKPVQELETIPDKSKQLTKYPESSDHKELMRLGNAFINPQVPSAKNLAIEKILQDSLNRGLLSKEKYDYRKGYLAFHRSNIINNKVVSFNEDLGIPVNKYAHLNDSFPYPVTVGLYALEQYSKFYKFGKNEFIAAFEKVCEWILNNQADNGDWGVPFDYEFFKGRTGGLMKSGWPSALGQGYCLSALARYYFHLKGRGDSKERLDSISKSMQLGLIAFETEVSERGVLRYFKDKYPFYEEYPSPIPSFVLNGFMFALLGLYDVWKALNSEKAKKMYEEGISTLVEILPYFDLGDRSAYDLTHLQSGGKFFPPNPARRGYHETHIKLLDALNSVENGKFADINTRWILYLYGVISPNN